jgi:hypothetical protein
MVILIWWMIITMIIIILQLFRALASFTLSGLKTSSASRTWNQRNRLDTKTWRNRLKWTKQGAEHGFNENVVLYGFYMVLKIFYTVWYRCYISFSLLYFLHVWIGFILFYISWLSFVLFCTSVLLFYMVYTCLSCLYGLTVVNNGGFMIEFHQQLMNTNGQSMVACMMLVRHLWTEWGGHQKTNHPYVFFWINGVD